MGINITRMRIIVIVCATLITSSIVAVGGLIGWVGLIIPHMARIVAGPGFQKASAGISAHGKYISSSGGRYRQGRNIDGDSAGNSDRRSGCSIFLDSHVPEPAVENAAVGKIA